MTKTFGRTFTILLSVFVLAGLAARAQEISGVSTVGFQWVKCFPVTSCLHGEKLEFIAYTDTEEDYAASVYYDVEGASATYFGSSSTALVAYDTGAQNPTATGTYIPPAPTLPAGYSGSPYAAGIYGEYTDHYVDCFFVAGYGYYDPYSFSIASGEPNGDYNSGWWYSVDAYGTYLAEAAILIGETGDISNQYTGDYTGGTIETVLYQDFIPPNNVQGPPAADCDLVVYAGDDRQTSTGAVVFTPLLASFRAMQQVSVGVGGYTLINPTNAPPINATGWTYQFPNSSLEAGVIPESAYNFDNIGKCSSKGINHYGHASTSNMHIGLNYDGATSSEVTLTGAAGNPVPLWAFDINWTADVILSESGGALHIGGSFTSDCYPAQELSVGSHDLVQYSPSSNNLVYITACLGGGSPYKKSINQTAPLTKYNGPTPPPPPIPLL